MLQFFSHVTQKSKKMVGNTIVYRLFGSALVQYVKVKRYHTSLRLILLKWMNGIEVPCHMGRLRNGSIALKCDQSKGHVLSMYDKKTLQQLITHSQDAAAFKSALLYVLGKKTDAISLSTMSSQVNQQGVFEMKMNEENIPLNEELFKYLLQ